MVEQRGEAPHDGEPEAHAAPRRGAARRARAHLVELLEDPLAVLGGDAGAGVDDVDRDAAAAPPRADERRRRARV